MSKFKIILATTQNNILGNNNSIPWLDKYNEDLKYFKKITSFTPFNNLKNIIIMGRKTWESLDNKKLKNRIPIIISTTLKTNNDYYVVSNFDKAIRLSNKIPYYQIWVIGGKHVYSSALNHYLCGDIYHTIIPEDYDGNIKLEIKDVS